MKRSLPLLASFCLILAACTDRTVSEADEATINNAANALEKAADTEVNRAIAEMEREAAARQAAKRDDNGNAATDSAE